VSKQPLLGVLVSRNKRNPPFSETKYLAMLTLKGQQHHVSVAVVMPDKISNNWRCEGYHYNCTQKKWEPASFPLPKYLIDRCFYPTASDYRYLKPYIDRLKTSPATLLSLGMKGKWQTYQILSTCEAIKPYLPKTVRIYKTEEVWPMLKEMRSVILKPIGGSQGQGVIAVIQSGQDQYQVLGRITGNKTIETTMNRNRLNKWLIKILSKRRYLIQPFLTLQTRSNQAFDVRVLVQKKAENEWGITGKAIRLGRKGSITSNLHSGGTAVRFEPFLQQEFPDQESKLKQLIESLSLSIPPIIEQAHGPLMELGIDYGIDRKGQIWVLETNSKPGRQVFVITKEKQSYEESIENTIRYVARLQAERSEKS
jgi:hypothetical protein